MLKKSSQFLCGLHAVYSRIMASSDLHDGRESCDVGLKGDLFRGIELSEQFLY